VEKCGGFGPPMHPGGDSTTRFVRRNRSIGNGGPALFVCRKRQPRPLEKNELRDNLARISIWM